MKPTTKSALLRVTIPIQGLLLITLLVSGLAADEMSPRAFHVIHVHGGILLVALTFVHIALNWSWIVNSYFKGRRKKAGASE